MAKAYKHNEKPSVVQEEDTVMRFYNSQEEQELERLKRNMNRSATEKFHALMGMMKTGNMFKRAIIHHKK
jgi:hypothetical protein